MKTFTFSSVSIAIIAFSFCAFATTAFAQTADASFARDLRMGASGTDVAALQMYLISKGHLNIPTPTGTFGALTRKAVVAWQTQAGISPASGFFGPLSRQRLNADVKMTGAQTTPTVNTAVVATPVSAIRTATPIASLEPGTGLPVRIKIEQLNVDAPIIPVGLTTSGAMDAPNTLTEVGWYIGGMRPGEIGTAVLDGHVAQIRGGVATLPGVFSRLNELRVGDRFTIVNDQGKTTTFAVRESRLFDPTADTTALFTSTDGRAHLNIITCDGTWNPVLKSFSQRLVLFAEAL